MPTDTCFKIQAGRIERLHIPADGLELVVSPSPSVLHQPLAQPGKADEHFEAWSLTHVAEIVTRMTPWATWYVAPAFGHVGGYFKEQFGGLALVLSGVGLIRSCWDPAWTVRTAMHEAWHLAEDYLSAAEFESVDMAARSGPQWPDAPSFRDYYSKPVERRARMYEAWAMSAWEAGGTPAVDKRAPHTLVFGRVYSGEIGFRVARRGLIPAPRMPEHLRQRLAERSATQKTFDAIRRSASAAWDWVADAWRSGSVVPGAQTAEPVFAAAAEPTSAALALLRDAEDAMAALPETALAAEIDEALERFTAGWEATAQALAAEAKA